MGKFSTDVAIKHYAREVWNIEPYTIDSRVLEQKRSEYL
jgi:hypothetical protein